jgi:uncharacterized membrane protein
MTIAETNADRVFAPHNVLLWLATMAGFVLSAISLLKICSDLCSETAQYRIFGMDFGWFGVAYFTVLLIVVSLRRYVPWTGWIAAILLFSSAGAEARFIWIQKYEIGQWCPVCLAIASAVFIACLATIWGTFQIYSAKGVCMRSKVNYLIIIAMFFALGMGGAMLGVKKEADAAELDLFLGKRSSSTTVYFVSDWFCPACIKMEPVIDDMFPAVAKLARVSFVDYPIHKETINYTPYNLQFLAFEKRKYISLRKALAGLALKTKNPTDASVQAVIKPLGVKLRTLSNSDVLYGMQANLMVYRGFDVNATPSAVITNSKTKKTKTLVGNQISEQAVKAAISEVEAR